MMDISNETSCYDGDRNSGQLIRVFFDIYFKNSTINIHDNSV